MPEPTTVVELPSAHFDSVLMLCRSAISVAYFKGTPRWSAAGRLPVLCCKATSAMPFLKRYRAAWWARVWASWRPSSNTGVLPAHAIQGAARVSVMPCRIPRSPGRILKHAKRRPCRAVEHDNLRPAVDELHAEIPAALTHQNATVVRCWRR